MRSHCDDIIPRLCCTIVEIALALSDGESHVLLVCRKQLWVVMLGNNIFCMRHVHIGIGMDTVGKVILQSNFKFITCGLGSTLVHVRSRSTEIGRHRTAAAGNHDVGTLLAEELKRTGYETTEESIVDTEVLLDGLLPMDIWVTYLCFLIPSINGFVVWVG